MKAISKIHTAMLKIHTAMPGIHNGSPRIPQNYRSVTTFSSSLTRND